MLIRIFAYIQSKNIQILREDTMSNFMENILREKCFRLPSFYLVGNWTLDSLRAKMGHKTELKFARLWDSTW